MSSPGSISGPGACACGPSGPGGGWSPVSPQEHAAQVVALRGLLSVSKPAADGGLPWCIDVGAGSGRIAVPLACVGACRVLAVDIDPDAVSACRVRAAAEGATGIEYRVADAAAPATDLVPSLVGFADTACCLGLTLMRFCSPFRAVVAMQRIGTAVRPGGWLAVDNSWDALWSEVAEGNWQAGVSEDGREQLVWSPGESVVAVRRGSSVDESCWVVREGDEPLRLWSRDTLSLLAAASGVWSSPEPDPTGGLLVFQRV